MTGPYLDALQTTLAAEHAAVFVIGYLGGQTSQSANPTLYAAIDGAYTTHRGRRDQLNSLVRKQGGEPVASEVAYQLPSGVSGDPDAVAEAALRVEQRCAQTYAYLVAHSPSKDREVAIGFLVDSAVRSLGLGGSPETLPGI